MKSNIDFYKYAQALSKLSRDHGDLEKIRQNISSFNQILQENKETFKFLKHPGVPGDEKTGFLESVAKKFKFSETTEGFLKLLVSEGNIEYLAEILNRYSLILRAMNKQIKVKVEGAYAKDKKALLEIKEVLSKKFGREIILEFSENSALIGGFRIIADGQVYDGSVKGELRRVEESLK